jgi:small subunit ribosomal protein S16
MLKIRLQRIGRRHDPHFRVVVTDARRGPKSGNFIEILGSYNAKMGEIKLEADRIKYWISVGAQTSGTVHNFLVDQKVIEGKKKNVLPKKTPIIKELTEEEKAAAAAPAKEEPTPEPVEEVPVEAKEEAPAVEEVATEETPAAPEESVEETLEVVSEEETPATEIEEESKEEESEAKEEVVAEEEKKEDAPEA